MDNYHVTRAKVPRVYTEFGGDSALRAELGGGPDWYWGMPGVHRAIAAPHAFAAVPDAPRHGDEHAQSLGYWTALHNLLLYPLGWSRPDRGLQWWYDAGKPTDDPTLAFIAEIWDRDGLLDGYLAWLLRRQLDFLSDTEQGPVHAERETLSDEWSRWLRDVTGAYDPVRYQWFRYATAGDSLHLSGSGGQERRPEPMASITVLDPARRRALFWAKRADTWYFNLARRGEGLPEIGDRSWHVDVVVESLGFLGTFRRSRVTGLWFAGQHRVHSRGN